MRRTHSQAIVWSSMVLAASLFVSACGEKPMGPLEEQAIQTVKNTRPGGDEEFHGGGQFSITSNVDLRADNAGRQGDKWENRQWTAGFVSQKDRIVDDLSQYFNVFKPSGARWVRFSYTDKSGPHEATWEVDIYSKKVEAKNDLAKELATPPAS